MNNDQTPLAEQLRPKKLKHFLGQKHLVGKNGPINKSLQNNSIYSMIFWGPPGSGKTSLARIIAKELNANFEELSPTTSGVKDIKNVVERSKQGLMSQNKTILFVDEIHRFNKAQQDYLLPHVEDGTLTLIGATTENPSFEIVSPLLSRTRVYKFKPIEKEHIENLLTKALKHLDSIELNKEAKKFLIEISNGDARRLLNDIEALKHTGENKFNIQDVKTVLQEKTNRYDKQGEEHYNTISAYIKSMRASNVNAALYYLARMIEGGEDPLFIARRMIVFASEDIGLADPKALDIANNVFRACEKVGLPECQINLAHGTTYLAKAEKNRSSYEAYFKALKDVKKQGNLPIPLHIRNAPTGLMEEMGYGKDYKMYPKNNKNYLPKELKNKEYLDE